MRGKFREPIWKKKKRKKKNSVLHLFSLHYFICKRDVLIKYTTWAKGRRRLMHSYKTEKNFPFSSCCVVFFSPHVELLCVVYIAHTPDYYDGYRYLESIIALFLRGRHVCAAGQCLLIRHKSATGSSSHSAAFQ